MAWQWSDRPFEECETDNIIAGEDGPRPEGVPPMPTGDGWEPYGQQFNKGYENRAKLKLPYGVAQRWRRARRVQNGFCSRVDRSFF